MYQLTVDDVVFIHDYILEKSGGLPHIQDRGLLESAVNKPHTHLFGVERYKNSFTKAAALLEAIALYHPFNDGNKRTAMAAAVLFLHLHDIETSFTNKEYETFMLRVVEERLSIKVIAEWLRQHASALAKVS